MNMTITEAAKLYGKQRKTLYRHIDAGRLSCSVRGDGHRVIGLSELIRCYGEPPSSPEDGDTLTRAMLEELQALRKEVEQLRADFRRLPPPPPESTLSAQSTETRKLDDPYCFPCRQVSDSALWRVVAKVNNGGGIGHRHKCFWESTQGAENRRCCA